MNNLRLWPKCLTRKTKSIEDILLSKSFLKKQISIVSDLVNKDKQVEIKKELKLFLKEGIRQRKLLSKELKTINKELKNKPDDEENLKKKIQYLLEIHPEEGLKSAERLLEIASEEKSDDAYAWYARVLRNCRKHVQSMEYCEKSLQKNPKNGLALKVKAALLGEPEFSSEASNEAVLSLIDEALEFEPKNINFLFEKVWILKETGNLEEAEDILKICQKHQDWNQEKIYYGFLSGIDDAAGRKEECLINSLKSVLLEPRTITGLCMLSIGYDNYSLFSQSLEMTKLFTKSYSQRCGDLDDNQKLFLANNYYNCGDYEECVKLSQETLKNQVTPKALIQLGYCYFYLRDYTQAIHFLEKAIELDLFTDPSLYRSFGLVCYERTILINQSIKESEDEYEILALESEKNEVLEKGGYAMLNSSRIDSSIFDDARLDLGEDSSWKVVLSVYLDFFNSLIDDIPLAKDSLEMERYMKNIDRYHNVRSWINRLLGNDCYVNDFQELESRNDVSERWEFVVKEASCRKEILNVKFDVSNDKKFIEIPKVFFG